ncbi:MAG: HAD-IA family hydrolase [Gemmataceae bacterium]
MLSSDIRAVYFDAVGTLLFPTPGAPEMYAQVARELGHAVDEPEMRKRISQAFRVEEQIDSDSGWITTEDREIARWRRIVADSISPDPALFDRLYHHFADPSGWTVHPEAAAVFAELHARRMVVGLGSNYDSRLHSVLAGHPELATLLPRVVISSEVGIRKPGAGFFAAVCESAGGLRPAQIAFVGDDFENDYAGADAAGMFAVQLTAKPKPGVRSIGRLLELLGEVGSDGLSRPEA